MTHAAQSKRALRSALVWEACWIPVEMATVALALSLGLRYEHWDAAGFCLFGICAVSWIVRLRHYSNAA